MGCDECSHQWRLAYSNDFEEVFYCIYCLTYAKVIEKFGTINLCKHKIIKE